MFHGIFRVTHFSLFASLCIGSLAHAAPAQIISAAELESLALSRHPAPQAMQARIHASDQQSLIAERIPDPQISWISAPNTWGNDVLKERHNVALSQVVPWFGKRHLAAEAQRQTSQALHNRLDAIRIRVGSEARLLFVRWYYIEQALAANSQNQNLLQDLSEVAEQAYSLAQDSQQAWLSAQLRQAQLQNNSLTLTRQREQLLADMQALVSQDTRHWKPAPLAATPKLDELSQLLSAGKQNNPAIAGQTNQIAAATQRTKLAEKAFFPDLKFIAAYNGIMDPVDKRLQLGVALEIPLDQVKRKANLSAAQARQQEARWELQDQQLQLERKIQNHYAAAAQADAAHALYKESIVPLAQQNLASARADWTSGNGLFQTVISAEEKLLQAKLELEKSRSDAWIHRIKLNELTGRAMETTLLGAAK